MHPANKVLLGVLSAGVIGGAALWEGDKRDPYEDIVGVLTVCYGYTGKDIVRNKTYTKAECDSLLKKELIVSQTAVIRCTHVPLSQNQFDAFTLFTYNVGTTAYCNSSLVKKLNKGDYYGACDGLKAWSYAGGKYVRGLNNRRLYERQMCLGQLK
ncbi:MAG TPA: lysozyme [Nitrososphaera sp.]|jgi:lysozyme|nr:lysozyme [Nitrososphaera sp.]